MRRNETVDGVEAIRKMASMSPETQQRFDMVVSAGSNEPLQIYVGCAAIGAAIGSKRAPISDANKKRIFDYAEYLLRFGSDQVSNAVATSMLEAIWNAALESSFDFESVDSFLGPEARRYLVAWDDFNDRRTPGLRRS
ncbi:DUF7674 family protein [Sphingomonas pruni]|uniref:DUF7674 family protein n=1 Tax=Sphingomonas pruni TaxID=40683 RepID=UPI00082A4632|nr:hypothetical protein [Sphingomonas pruni]